MTGRQFVVALESQGFVTRRRCKSFVWLARGEQTLMVDEEATIPEAFLARLLVPPSRPPASVTARQPGGPSSSHAAVVPVPSVNKA
jgi:hypothetical protein